MEETNYERHVTSASEDGAVGVLDGEKTTAGTVNSVQGDEPPMEGTMRPSQKTFLQKMGFWCGPRKPNRLWRLFKQPLYFLSWPTIVWAGFSYGQNLVWFNVLNATASLILSSPPYNFSAAMVGVAFVSAFLGTIVA